MTKLDRLTAKVFADNAPADEIGQFGSALSGTKVLTSDVATIQALPAYTSGWGSAVISNRNYPTMQEFNGLLKVMSYQSAYTLQQGIPEYDSGTIYYIGSIVKSLDADNNAVLYQSVADNNINNQLTDTTKWIKVELGGNSRNIGEIVQSTIPLTDAGLHLLDGSLLDGSGSYSEFVDYIANLWDESDKVKRVDTVGSLTVTDGVLSGFSTSNYAEFPVNFRPSSHPWEMVFKVTTGNDVTTSQYVMTMQKGLTNDTRYATRIGINADSQFNISVSYDGTNWDIVGTSTTGATGTYTVLANTTYWLKFEYTGSAYKLSYSTDGETYTVDCNVSSSTPMYNSNTACLIGVWNNGSFTNPFLGTIDLNGCYINLGDNRWWTGMTPKWGYSEAEWQQTITDSGSCGKFVYDMVANTVRLPRISNILQSTYTVDDVTKMVQAGLPNITGVAHGISRGDNLQEAGTSALYWLAQNYNTSWDTKTGSFSRDISLDASRSNSIYGNSTTVQPQTIRVLVYIVVATSTKTDIQVDIDEIATDLNGKADVDLTNCDNNGRILMSEMPMASNKYINLTLGTSGATYTAPANGYFYIRKACGTTNHVYCAIYASGSSGSINDISHCTGVVADEITCLLPVKKGTVVGISYTATGATTTFRFVYAVGSESEAS